MTVTECSHRWRRTGTELHPTETLRLWTCPWCGTTRTTTHPYLDHAIKQKQVADLLRLNPPQETPDE